MQVEGQRAQQIMWAWGAAFATTRVSMPKEGAIWLERATGAAFDALLSKQSEEEAEPLVAFDAVEVSDCVSAHGFGPPTPLGYGIARDVLAAGASMAEAASEVVAREAAYDLLQERVRANGREARDAEASGFWRVHESYQALAERIAEMDREQVRGVVSAERIVAEVAWQSLVEESAGAGVRPDSVALVGYVGSFVLNGAQELHVERAMMVHHSAEEPVAGAQPSL